MRKAIELFAGGGGFRLGLENNFETVLAIEKDPKIAEVYEKNFPNSNLIAGCVSKVDFKSHRDVDLLVGGPPCQDYSYANTLNASNTSERSQLGLEMLRAIEECRPKQFILENVTGYKESLLWQQFKLRCEQMNYKIKFHQYT